jgi:acetylornithine deacetylase
MTQSRQAADAQGGLCADSASQPVLCPDDKQILRFLSDCIKLASISGQESAFVRLIENWAAGEGLSTECFETDEAALATYPQLSQRHIPLRGRPTLIVGVSKGASGGRRLLFNAHSDVVGAGDESAWRYPPFGGQIVGDRVYGRGASDAKGPLVAALWAMATVAQQRAEKSGPASDGGDVLLELVPGEEDCVGLGTLTSVVHGIEADSVIVLEPTDGQPRSASRGGCRFEIVCRGSSAHGTVKWLGSDALRLLRRVMDALDKLEHRFNDRAADGRFAGYPIARPITVDAAGGAGGQGMIASEARCLGYLELLPGDDRHQWKQRLRDELTSLLGSAATDVSISFSEEYEGHELLEDDPLYRIATDVAAAARPDEAQSSGAHSSGGQSVSRLSGFNSGCEAGLRAKLRGTPTLVWGPGSLDRAHAANEFLTLGELRQTAELFVDLIARYTSRARS